MDQLQYVDAPPTVGARDVVLIIWRRTWLILLIMAVCVATALYITKKTHPAWQGHAQLSIVASGNSGQGSLASLSNVLESPDTEVIMLNNFGAHFVLDETHDSKTGARTDWLNSEAINANPPNKHPELIGISAQELQKNISVNVPRDTALLDVSVTASSKELAAALTNDVADAFIYQKLQAAKQKSASQITQLTFRLRKANKDLKLSEQAELDYRRKKNMVNIPAQTTEILNQYMAQQAAIPGIQQELNSEQTHAQELGQRLKIANSDINAGSGLRDDAYVLGLQAQYLQLLQDKATAESKGYRPSAFGVLTQNFDSQLKDVHDRLQKAVQATLDPKIVSLPNQRTLKDQYEQVQMDILLAQSRLKSAQNQVASLRPSLNAVPNTTEEDARLTRDAELKRGLYMQLQSALNGAEINQNTETANVQYVFRSPLPEAPIRPVPLTNLLLGVGVGLFLSLLAVLVVEQSDRRVRSIDSVRGLVSGPIIGALPQMSRTEVSNLLKGNTPVPALEAYNIAWANLALVVRNATHGDIWNHKIILVTSAVAGEGKSLTAAELSRSLARAGKNVVLVNADMRRPTQNLLFNTDEPNGLADVLTGSMTLDQALVSSNIANLSILHSGSTQRNPTELISRPRMAETLKTLRSEADVVIVDTPACSAVADALLLAPYADCILYVVGTGLVDENLLRDTTLALSAAAPKTMAYFVNRVPRSGVQSYQGYYSYSSDSAARPVAALATASAISEGRPTGRTATVSSDDEMNRTQIFDLRAVRIGSRLIALDGPHAGQEFMLTTDRLTIGREVDNGIVLADDMSVSGHHAYVAEDGGQHILHDDGSTNGTLVNDARVSRRALAIGDIVQFGKSRFRYE